jgi:hypothetical protein
MKCKKDKQLQIRITQKEKVFIRKAAKNAGMDISQWVLSKIAICSRMNLENLIEELACSDDKTYPIAAINDFLCKISRQEFEILFGEPVSFDISEYWNNYLAAMIEQASHIKKTAAPNWLNEIKPLKEPVFGTDLQSLRLHLLANSPPPFKKRNIFIDSTLGSRI